MESDPVVCFMYMGARCPVTAAASLLRVLGLLSLGEILYRDAGVAFQELFVFDLVQ